MAVVKVLHEFGHGLSCKHFGGECHEMGFMLLVFTPALYCNVSDSWMLPNKYARAAIGAILVGVGITLMISASNELRAAHEVSPEQTADEVAPADPVAELTDTLQRVQAEFANYRKRVDRERKDLREFLIAEALSDLLPVIDDLERALQATGSDAEALRKGVELIHQQMLDLLRKRGAKAIEAVGTDFDPRIHESVMLESSEAHREGEVIAEFRRGYMLGERLLRPSMVKVAKA